MFASKRDQEGDIERSDAIVEDEGGMPLWLDILLTIVCTISFVVVFRMFIVDLYVIPSGSMLNTIQIDDQIVGEKVSYYFRGPEPGEIVTFADPEDYSVTLIKRVIATAGQTVDLVDGVVVVDGVALDEPYTEGRRSDPIDRYSIVLSEPMSYPFTVPEGYVWVMGDNRTNSLDSRYFGPVEVSAISSHALFVYWPFSNAKTF